MHERQQRSVVGPQEEKGDNSSLTRCPTQSSSLSDHSNSYLDRVLFNDLVQIVPLVQSLIDSKASSSFTRRGSMIHTKAPSRESLSKRMSILKRKDKEEFVSLKKQVEELQRKLSVKDELLESAEKSRNQLNALNAKLDELKHHVSEKDCLLKSTQGQLFDLKMKLADKQATLEKTHWEAMTSSKKVETLQEELDSMQGDILSFTLLLEGLRITDTAEFTDDYDIKPYDFDHLLNIDDWDQMEMQKMEEARKAYIATVAAAKEKQDEDSIATAANARLRLQSFLFKPKTFNL